MKRSFQNILLLSLSILVSSKGMSQMLPKRLHPLGNPIRGPLSNSINDIQIIDDEVWIGSYGLSRTADNGATWTGYSQADGLGKGSISAIAERNGTIWVATGYDTLVPNSGALSAGGGLSCSTDQGKTWHWIPQPIDSLNETAYAPTTTHIQNLSYDIALTDEAIWIASWGGGLRRSFDIETGESWKVVTVDDLPFDVSNNNYIHMAFSVIYDETALWVGSAAGIHKSMDGGETWTTFNHQNQPEGISGNFVVAIAHQPTNEKDIIWAATIEAVDADEYRAVSKTEDGGLTWTVMLENEFAHNFEFDPVDGAVYVATDNGLFKSLDYGETWAVFPQIIDSETGEKVYTTEINSVAVGTDQTLWAGTNDGLAQSADLGVTWTIHRAFQTPGENKRPKTYAYPNPFSPLRHNLINGDGHVRFQYCTSEDVKVTVRVYDFGMSLVKTVVDGKDRPAGDFSEVWDGRNELGDMAANGVYFYKITFSKGETLWGKVMVVN